MGTLSLIYYDPARVGNLGGIGSLERASKRSARKWLSTQDTYSLHKPTRRRFPRRRVIVSGIDDQWQADLVDLSSLKKENKNYKHLLTCIDIFSKFAWIEPLKDKNGKSLKEAFARILKKVQRKPRALQTDKGSEFTNKLLQRWLSSRNIHFFTTHNEETKASIVERFNRTIKTRMWRYFTSKNTKKYIGVLKDLVHSYNHSYHRSIKRTPASVGYENQEKVWLTLYADSSRIEAPKLSIGDYVRISKARGNFQKGYLPNWSEELFIITEAVHGKPPYYKLKDLDGENIEGTFYSQELQKVIKNNDVYKVENILSSRKKSGKKQFLIKWLGYPKKFYLWIDAENIVRYE